MDFAGTYPLPDSQLDRFMLRMSMGYPDRDAERAMLSSIDRRSLLETLTPCLVPEQILELRHASTAVLAIRATSVFFMCSNSLQGLGDHDGPGRSAAAFAAS